MWAFGRHQAADGLTSRGERRCVRHFESESWNRREYKPSGASASSAVLYLLAAAMQRRRTRSDGFLIGPAVGAGDGESEDTARRCS